MTGPGTNEPCRRTPPTSDDGGKDRTYGVPLHAPAPQPIAHLIVRHEFTHGRNVRHRSPWTPPVRSCPTPTAPSSLAGLLDLVQIHLVDHPPVVANLPVLDEEIVDRCRAHPLHHRLGLVRAGGLYCFKIVRGGRISPSLRHVRPCC